MIPLAYRPAINLVDKPRQFVHLWSPSEPRLEFCERESTLCAVFVFSFRWKIFAGLWGAETKITLYFSKNESQTCKTTVPLWGLTFFLCALQESLLLLDVQSGFFSALISNSKGNKARASWTSLQLREPSQIKTSPNRNMTSICKKRPLLSSEWDKKWPATSEEIRLHVTQRSFASNHRTCAFDRVIRFGAPDSDFSTSLYWTHCSLM